MSEAKGKKEEYKWKEKGKGQDQWMRTVGRRGQGDNLVTAL